MSYKTIIVKVVFAIAITLSSFILNLSYFCCRWLCWNELVFSLLSSFAGGIFLSLALLHTLPDVSLLFEQLGGAEKYAGFPLPYAIAVFSYAFFFILDWIVLWSCSGGHSHDFEHLDQEWEIKDMTVPQHELHQDNEAQQLSSIEGGKEIKEE